MISLEELFKEKRECCGCGSCADVCPKTVLVMKEDNSGFLYPEIIHGDECIDCKLCVKICPEKNYGTVDSSFSSFHAGYLEDEKELLSCASGGLATAISRKILNTGGVVYGCAYSDDWRSITYRRVTHPDGLDALKTSKYAQSTKGDTYRRITDDLANGRTVLFIGCPCDVLAVKIRIPEKLQKNLYLVELICHGPTSQKVHRQYLESITSKGEEPMFFSTRAKKNGEWKPFYIHTQFSDGRDYYEQFHTSSYGAAFRYLKRPSCFRAG